MIEYCRYEKFDISEQFKMLKHETEKFWEDAEIYSNIYGFQIQKGTKWLKGLCEDEIVQFEKDVGFEFPEVYKVYLRNMNGTDKPTINIYGGSGEPYSYGVGYYSYPRDIEIIREKLSWIYDAFGVDENYLKNNFVPHIMPIESHRFLIMDNSESNPVLSMYGDDVILYASNIVEYIYHDIFCFHRRAEGLNYDLSIKLWLE